MSRGNDKEYMIAFRIKFLYFKIEHDIHYFNHYSRTIYAGTCGCDLQIVRGGKTEAHLRQTSLNPLARFGNKTSRTRFLS